MEEEEEEKQELEEMDLTVDRVGAGSLTRANGRVTDGEEERYGGCSERRAQAREYDRGVPAAHPTLRMRRARSRAPSGRIQSAQRRSVSRNAAIDYHGPAYRYYRPTPGNVARARTHTQIHRYIHDHLHKRPLSAALGVLVSFVPLVLSIPRPHAHTAN